MADAVLLEKRHPGVGFGAVDGAVAAGAYSAPLGDEQRDAAAQRRLRLVAQELAVSAGVEVQGICDIGSRNRIGRRHVHILRPRGSTHDDEVVRIDRTDRGYDRLRIRFDDAAPGNLQGLIVDFIDDVVPVAVAPGHVLEKADGLRALAFGIVRMPVDNDVQIVGDGRIHQGDDTGAVGVWIHGITAVGVGAHGRTHDGGAEIVLQPVHGAGGIESFAAPPVVAPEKAVTREAFRDPAAENAVPLHRQRRHVRAGGGYEQQQAAY